MTTLASTMWVSKQMIDYAAIDVRAHAAEELKRKVEEHARREGYTIVPGTAKLESVPFRNVSKIDGHGLRRILEWLRVVPRHTQIFEGEQMRLIVEADPKTSRASGA